MFKLSLAAGICAALTSAASAQSGSSAPPTVTAIPAPQAVPVSAPQAVTAVRPLAGNVLPANTELTLRLDQEVNSKRAKEGYLFGLSVATDVMLGQYIVIPRGTPAKGIVTYRTGKGAFGKSAKMEIDLQSVDLNGQIIPISGHYRQEGEGNTGATVGTAVAAGPFAALVTGRSAVFAQGREFKAFTRAALPVELPK